MAYLLDSDVFIRAKNDHYGFDLCPGFWEWLERVRVSPPRVPERCLR